VDPLELPECQEVLEDLVCRVRKDSQDPQERRVTPEPRDCRVSLDFRDFKERRDNKETQDLRETRDQQDSRDRRVWVYQDQREHQDHSGLTALWAVQVIPELKDHPVLLVHQALLVC